MHPFLTHWLKIIGGALTLVVLAPVAFFAFVFWTADTSPAVIENYTPTAFNEHSTTPFYYSIGDNLFYSDRIDTASKVLFTGKPESVLPSPNGKHALVVSDGMLWLISPDSGGPIRVTSVAPHSPNGKPIGKDYYRNNYFQWATDSSRFYLIKDRYYETRGAQLFSIHGELTEYDISSNQLRKVFAPFRAYRYFLTDKGIFFEEANDKGDVLLTVWREGFSFPVSDISPNGFRANGKAFQFRSKPFYTFTIHEYSKEVFRSLGLEVERERVNQAPPVGHLHLKTKRLLSIREGRGIKGPLDGYSSIHSAFLPGERYFLLNLYTETFSGQLLIDTLTGQHKPLPKGTRVYRNINTYNFSNWTVTPNGVKVDLTREERSTHYW